MNTPPIPQTQYNAPRQYDYRLPSQPVVRVLFNDVAEFKRELSIAGPNVDPVVRVTNTFRSTAIEPVRFVSVRAGFLRKLDGGVLQLIELDRPVGDVLSGCNDGASTRVLDKAEEIQNDLTAHAQTLKLNVRAGMYESL